jgi:hypothetical protein
MDLHVAAHQAAVRQRQQRALEVRAGPAPAPAGKDHPERALGGVGEPAAAIAPRLPGVGQLGLGGDAPPPRAPRWPWRGRALERRWIGRGGRGGCGD